MRQAERDALRNRINDVKRNAVLVELSTGRIVARATGVLLVAASLPVVSNRSLQGYDQDAKCPATKQTPAGVMVMAHHPAPRVVNGGEEHEYCPRTSMGRS